MNHDRAGMQSRGVFVELTDEEVAAVQGWQAANRFETIESALRELIRLGLISEIGRSYRMASAPDYAADRDEDVS